MCKYCEALTADKMDSYQHKYRELLPISVDANDYEEYEVMACIIPPTPISERQHEHDGLTSNLNVYFSDEHARVANIFIPSELPLPKGMGFLLQRPSLQQGLPCCIG